MSSSPATSLRIFSYDEWSNLYPDADAKAERGKAYPLHFMLARNPKEATVIERIGKATDKLIAADKDRHNLTPLMVATMRGNTRLVDELLKKDLVKTHINDQDKYGWTALHHAALTSDEIVQKLLSAGANPRCLTNCNGLPEHLKALTTWGSSPRALENVSFAGKPLTEEIAKSTFGMTSCRDLPFFPPTHLKNLWQQEPANDRAVLANLVPQSQQKPKVAISAIREGFYGLSAMADIPQGTVIGGYGGVFTPLQRPFSEFPFAFASGVEGDYCFGEFNAKEVGNATRFANHAFPNVSSFSLPSNGITKETLIAHRNIKKGEPIFFNYGASYFSLSYGPQILFNQEEVHAFFKNDLATISQKIKKLSEEFHAATSDKTQLSTYLNATAYSDNASFPLDNPISLINLHFSGIVPVKEWLKLLTEGKEDWVQNWKNKKGLFIESYLQALLLRLTQIDHNMQTKAKEHYPLFQKWVLSHCQTLTLPNLIKAMEWIEENPNSIEQVEERLKSYDWTKDETNLYSYKNRRAAIENQFDTKCLAGTNPFTFFSSKQFNLEHIKKVLAGYGPDFSGSEAERIFNEIIASIPSNRAAQAQYLQKLHAEAAKLKNLLQ